MNDQIFKKIVESAPKAFPFVVIPTESHKSIPGKGKVSCQIILFNL